MRRTVISTWVAAFAALLLPTQGRADVYSGEPLSEATSDLKKADAVLVNHQPSTADALRKVEVWRLPDGRRVRLACKARRTGGAFTVDTVEVSSAKRGESEKFAKTVSVELPKSAQ